MKCKLRIVELEDSDISDFDIPSHYLILHIKKIEDFILLLKREIIGYKEEDGKGIKEIIVFRFINNLYRIMIDSINHCRTDFKNNEIKELFKKIVN